MRVLDERTRPWWALIGACSGLFVLMLDSTIVSLALPSIRADVGADSTELQWTMNVYLLTAAVLVVTAGRLGDMWGRKRVFVAGMALFGAGSVLSGAAQDPQMLIGGRVVQGTGAAALVTLSLAIVCNAFPAAAQARALGIWAAVSAIALAVGPMVGGALIEADWRLIFWINLPVVAIGTAIVLIAARESTDPGAERRVDLPGLVTLTAGLTALVLAMIQAQEWASASIVALAVAGVAMLGAFVAIERRARNPIVELELFRNGPYLGASAAAFAVVGCYWSLMFFQPQYLQDVLGHSAILSGLLILPVTMPMVLISPFCGALISRFGARGLMTFGVASGVAGVLVLTQVGAGSSYSLALAGYLLFGVSIGLVYAPMSTAAMAAMPAEKAGVASGVLAMIRLVGGALALAATGAVFSALLADGDSFAAAIAGSNWVLIALGVLGTILTWAFVRDVTPAGPDPAVAGEPPPEQLLHHRHHRRFHL
jgi:EmrB/QacA subfamily drug resistance transporter